MTYPSLGMELMVHLAVQAHLMLKVSGETLAKFIDDGAVELYHNNSKKFETTSAGVTVTGHGYCH